MTTEKSPDTVSQAAALAQIRGSLRRYAFIFTALGALFTAANVVHQMYIRSVDRATLISRDPVLVERQLYISKMTQGGKEYSVSFRSDDEFRLSLIVLMNYYETTAEMLQNWLLIGHVVRRSLSCPLGKHARIFLLGESRPGYWTTDGAFFSRDQFPATAALFDQIKNDEVYCEPLWR